MSNRSKEFWALTLKILKEGNDVIYTRFTIRELTIIFRILSIYQESTGDENHQVWLIRKSISDFVQAHVMKKGKKNEKTKIVKKAKATSKTKTSTRRKK